MDEKEVQARVAFKLNDILSHIEQSVHRNKALAFNLTFSNDIRGGEKCQHYSEAFEQLRSVFLKEIEMPVPRNDMHERNKKEKRNEAVDEIMKMLPMEDRRRVGRVVQIIEKCMEE